MSRAAEDKRGIAPQRYLGHVRAREGRTREALQLQREALVIAHELVDLQAVVEILLDVASLAVNGRSFETAATLLGAPARSRRRPGVCARSR